jgi:hypothetical protein
MESDLAFISVPLVFIIVFVQVPCCFCYASVVQFEVGHCNTSSIALFAHYYFGYSWSFVFPDEHYG